MKVEIVIKQDLDEPYMVIYTKEVTTEIQNIIENKGAMQNKILTGTKNEKIFILSPDDIYSFFSEGQKIYAKTDDGNLWVKQKLYQLEELLNGSSFIRISNSCIANVNKIKNLELSFGGTLGLVFKNGDTEFVSRRYVSKIKNYLGI